MTKTIILAFGAIALLCLIVLWLSYLWYASRIQIADDDDQIYGDVPYFVPPANEPSSSPLRPSPEPMGM